MYLLRLALRPWRIAPLSQLFSALAMGFLLLLGGMLLWMDQGLKPVIARLQGEQVVTAYLDPALGEEEEGKVLDSIRVTVGASPDREVRLVKPRGFVEELKKPYPELARELEDLGTEMEQVVPRYVSITGILSSKVLEQVKAITGIEAAESSRDRYGHVVGAFSAIRWVSKALAAGLALAILTGLIHLARMNSYLHQDAISLLRLWGAENWALRLPGMVSGLIVGALGGTIASASWIALSSPLTERVRGLSVMLRDLPAPSFQFALLLALAGIAVGLLSGAVGLLPAAAAGGSQRKSGF